MRRISMFLMCAITFLVTSTSFAHAENRKVKIINETHTTITRIYGSNVGTDKWEEDILGNNVLIPGNNITINFDDGSGYCKFDLKIVFSNNRILKRHNFDVCKIGFYRITDD